MGTIFSVVQIYLIFTQATIVLASLSGHTGCYVTATCLGDMSLCMYRSGDKLLKQVAWQSLRQIALCELENFCENLCLSNRILLQQITQIQFDSILWDLLQRQNSVEETKIFTKILQYKQRNYFVSVTCQSNISLQLVCFNIKSTHSRFWQIQSHRAL